MKKTLDFDRFMREKDREYITVTVYGKQYKVLAEVPACIPLMMARAEETGVADKGEATLATIRAAKILFGDAAISEFENKGMSANDMGQLVQEVFKAIGGDEDETEDAEEYDDESGLRTIGGDPHAKK